MSKQLLPERKLVFSHADIMKELNANDSYHIYEDKVMFKWLYHREMGIAMRVNDRVDHYHVDENRLSFCVESYMDAFQIKESITLNKKQRNAVKSAFVSSSGLCVLTGLPGTGKTSVIKCIEYIADEEMIVYEMASPTGKSAIKMGRKAKTIHRLLSPVFDRHSFTFSKDETNPIAASLIILDEGAGSHIPLIAKKVNDGEYLTDSDLNNASVKFIHCVEEAEVQQHVLDFYRANKNKCKTKILAPNNNVVGLLNVDIHLDEYDTLDPVFESGEEVMCVCNEYDENGDGSVNIDTSMLNGEFATFGSYQDGGRVEISKLDNSRSKITMKSDNIKYGYCITIHKSQGDEYEKVLLVLYKPPYIMLNRNLLYTAITRAKTHLTIIGTAGYLKKCIDVSLSQCDILESLIRELRGAVI
eukprot:gene28854-biopygen32754